MSDDAANDADGDRSNSAEAGGFSSRQGKAHTPRTESGLTALKEQRMIHEAARRGWLKDGRWPTEATPTELKNRQHERGELTAKEMAVAVTTVNMGIGLEPNKTISQNEATSEHYRMARGSLAQKAASTIVMMERQNQMDDLMALKLQADTDNARALSSGVLEGIVGECVEAVRESVGADQARDVHALLAERLTVEGANRRGTDWTPDQDVREMNATIQGPPEEN